MMSAGRLFLIPIYWAIIGVGADMPNVAHLKLKIQNSNFEEEKELRFEGCGFFSPKQ